MSGDKNFDYSRRPVGGTGKPVSGVSPEGTRNDPRQGNGAASPADEKSIWGKLNPVGWFSSSETRKAPAVSQVASDAPTNSPAMMCRSFDLI